ncbi:pentatricopeptide repeat domain-containing protein 1 [Schistosoma bovis]|uniref:Pentatricopeptide repeat domain-containing protein 1 n=2 Tax=Schistosoma bovis TaxID=6184 RepID=A0A430PX77_SCHBO|nr:pentatricopeptide repeat domain-containing protein 1 [Schistosoma bovis]
MLNAYSTIYIVHYSNSISAGDIHGCLRALDMMLATENIDRFSRKSIGCKNKLLFADSFTISSVLSAIEPASAKRNLESCRRRMGLSKQSANSNDVFNRVSPFQLALSLWHDLVPLSNNDVAPHHFTLLARIMGLQNDCLDANNNCEIVFVNNTRYKSFQDIFKPSSGDSSSSVNLIHPSCTSRELASMMIAQATQSSLLSSTSTVELKSTSSESMIDETPESLQFDWNDTMLALRSPINLLLPTDKPIVVR